jgi:hypothetical protein
LSLVGLIIWQIVQIGNIAIIFSIMADGLAAIPTVIKSYKDPDSENWLVYLMSAISAGLTLLTIKIWNFQHFAFPIYILLICALIFILVKFRIGKKLT